MLIDARETTALAEMLRMHISPGDAERLSGDMSSVLDYVRKLDELDVSGVDPMGVASGGYAELREDVPGPCLAPEDLETLSGGAFDPQAGAFVTKPIFV
ncbi:MAG: Asp-tRNA(Asn)/Glu-tRNA(Gln) amidotransferase GatCAB subunit C [Planctomycetota bacterium]|jgi:aspartyl-tRNA(Asn)/glutamyl-tRNA(Gln) amidotransferase subunit C|nr:Asp-tRNA(Asn)/Glu-tRNA(Gln) amidotransferase GatCAB subunit C [Planctomycetota bacterium]